MKYKFLFFFLVLLVLLKIFSFNCFNYNQSNEQLVFVDSLKSVDENKISYYVRLKNNKKYLLNIYNSKYSDENINLEICKNYSYGDVLKVKGNISIPKRLNNPGEFNYKLYLYSNNIYGVISTYAVPQKTPCNLNFFNKGIRKIYNLKQNVSVIIENSTAVKYSQIIKAMVYGDTINLEENVQKEFENIGVIHLMSISGTHIVLFLKIISLLLNEKKQNKNIFKNIIKIFAILLYIVFTGFSISVIRAGIMAIIGIIYNICNKKKNKFIILIITAIIIFLYNPYVIFNIGAILSFMASLGIYMFKSNILNSLSYFTKNIKKDSIKKILLWMLESISITLSVQLLIFPIQLSTFNKIQFPLIISNLLVGILSIPVITLGTIGIFLITFPAIASKIFSIAQFFVIILDKVVKLLNKISFSITSVSLPLVFYIFYYIFVLSVYLSLHIKAISKVSKLNKKYFLNLFKKIKYLNYTLVFILITFIIFINVYSCYYSKYVYFFNVEQGDMSFIKYKEESIIVDIGSTSNNTAFNVISNYFKSINFSYVDVVIISHMHADHINGLEKFLNEYKVGIIIYPKPYEINEQYINFLDVIKKHNIKSRQVKSGDVIKLKNLTIDIILPGEKLINSQNGTNDNSLIFNIKIKDKNLLYMGDSGKPAESLLIKQKLLPKEIYILKVGHHGSNTSTTLEFLDEICINNAVISASSKYYGHPSSEVLKRLKHERIYTYLTEKNGAIKFTLD